VGHLLRRLIRRAAPLFLLTRRDAWCYIQRVQHSGVRAFLGPSAGAVLIGLVGCGGGGSATPSGPAPTPTPLSRPNIVLVVTDDLDVPSAAVLPQLDGLMARAGVAFTSAFASTPVCAPSRASILTGLYTHDHGVRGNAAPEGGFPLFRPREGSTLATWLKGAGYRTALVGKYLNSYASGADDDYVPPGWDEWFGRLSAYETLRYLDWWANDNGEVFHYGTGPEDYSTDVEAKRALDFVRRAATMGQPFFLYVAPESPHVPALYPERHGAEFRYELAPRVPSFNEDDVGDKPLFVRKTKQLTDAQIDALDKLQRFRLRSMRAVEDLLGQLLQALVDGGQIDRTFVFFTSDNGLLMGQHRIYAHKGIFYDEAVRVPLLVRGPGVAAGQSRAELVSLVDLAPTILELAGATTADALEGRSLVPLLRGQATPGDWRRDVLLENYDPELNAALLTDRWSYVEYSSDEYELYDCAADPYQLQSLHRTADPAVMSQLAARLHELAACRGTSCR
jgi:N-acetylglucosamine-6-sulfatase